MLSLSGRGKVLRNEMLGDRYSSTSIRGRSSHLKLEPRHHAITQSSNSSSTSLSLLSHLLLFIHLLLLAITPSVSAFLCVRGSPKSVLAIKHCSILISSHHLEQPQWRPSLLSSHSSSWLAQHLLPWCPSIKAVQHPLPRSRFSPTRNGRPLRLVKRARSMT
jgi:hypothetical protein